MAFLARSVDPALELVAPVRYKENAAESAATGRLALDLAMDIGVWMRAEVLEDKLDAPNEGKPEQAWNLARWPTGLSDPGQHRLFVAVDGAWRGYFQLSGEALFNPADSRTPYTLLFDTRTWTAIAPTPVRRFRGFTYKVPGANPGTHAE